MTHCWASLLGNCGGKLSREHIVSRNLLAQEVRFSGFFSKDEKVTTVGRSSFVSKCLCKRHNNLLSACDAEAKLFRDAMAWWGRGRQSDDRPDTLWHIDAFLLAKWFAKTVCNVAAVSGRHIPRPFVHYAFSQCDDPFVHFYFLPGVGDVLEINRQPQEFHWLYDRRNNDRVAVVCYFFGLPFLITTFDIDGCQADICDRLEIHTSRRGAAFIDRVARINICNGPENRGALVFHWPEFGAGVHVDVDVFALCRAATTIGGTINLLHTFDVVRSACVPFSHQSCTVAALLRFEQSEVGRHEVRLSFEDQTGKSRDYLTESIDVAFQDHSDLPSLTYPLIADIQEITFSEFGDFKIVLYVDGKPIASRPVFVRQRKPV